MDMTNLAHKAIEVRQFNRFYTKKIGLLTEEYLRSPFSLTEARVIYELARHDQVTASELADELSLDAGQLSRILSGFKKQGLINKLPSPKDGRQTILSLTENGHSAFNALDAKSQAEIERMLTLLSPEDQNRLVTAMRTIQSLLGAQVEPPVPHILRPPRPGDMGWVIQRHGTLYAEEYGWDDTFEALVADIVAKFMQNLDPKRERCWIAERDGENVGSVFLVKKTDTVAKLRLLLIEPRARGLGMGKRLVDECIRFARQASYKKITLWTNSVLLAARHIYEKTGFQLVEEEPHHSFGHDLVGETWELEL